VRSSIPSTHPHPGRKNRHAGPVPPWPFLLPLLLALLAFASPGRGEILREFELEGNRLLVGDLAGTVELTAAEGEVFRVEARVRGKDATEDAITFDLKEGSSHSQLILRYPTEEHHEYVYPLLGRRSRSEFDYDPARHGEGSLLRRLLGDRKRRVVVSGGGDGMELWVDLTIHVPRGRECTVYLGCGEISAKEVRGELELIAVQGTVTAEEVVGDVSADTGSGDVRLARIQGKVEVDTGSGAVRLESIEGKTTADTGSGEVEATGIQGSLSIDTGSGAVVVRSSRGGKLTIDTGSSAVRLEDTEAQRVSVDTGIGAIRLEGLRCRELSVDTGSGGISARGLRALRAQMETGSGDLRVVFERLEEGQFELETGSGDIELGLPREASARIDASWSSGGIHLEREDAHVESKEDDRLIARVGAGEARVSLSTGSGSITVR